MNRRFQRIVMVVAALALLVAPTAFAPPIWGITYEYFTDATFSYVVGTVNLPTTACPDRGGSDGTTSDYRIEYIYSNCYQQAPESFSQRHCQVYSNGDWQEVSCYQ